MTPEERRLYNKKYREENKSNDKKYYERRKDRRKSVREDGKQSVINAIKSGIINDRDIWDKWCDNNRYRSNRKKKPYSADFTNDVMFEMLTKGCFYCLGTATTIDRLDSSLNHTPGNCVGACFGCNISKGTSDPSAFIMKAYFRYTGKYYNDDTDIWYTYKNKPSMTDYKKRADNKKVNFELTKEVFDELCKGDCVYCKRKPDTFFGIDRIYPEKGYAVDNVVTCCFDCNNDKASNSVKETVERNKIISDRLDNGEFDISSLCKIVPKTNIHKGIQPSSKKVCVYGKVYVSFIEASRETQHRPQYVSDCIKLGRHSDDIFEISNDFYDFMKEYDFENITKKMYKLFDKI